MRFATDSLKVMNLLSFATGCSSLFFSSVMTHMKNCSPKKIQLLVTNNNNYLLPVTSQNSVYFSFPGQNIGVVFNRKSAGSIVKQSVKTWYDGAAKVYDFSNGNPDQVS